MTVPARVSFVTLAVDDLPRMADFFRQFGWPEAADNDEKFKDPERNVWDVVWADGTSFDERGGLIFP